ncbi:MAG TPA: condensation domain-containing protein, partial [Mucilaginibacter sp.]
MPIELELDYWKDKLKDIKPLDLNTDYPKPDARNTKKGSVDFSVGEEIIKPLSLVGERNNVSLFVTLLTAYKILLYRYSGQEDISVGNLTCGACDAKNETDPGTLILRSEINGNNQFDELSQRVKALVNEACEHLKVPFEIVADLLVQDLNLSMNDLFRAMFVMQNETDGRDKLSKKHTSAADIILILKEEGAGLQGTVEYDAELYKEETILRFAEHYKILLSSIIAYPEKSIGALPILTKAEEHKLLYEFNDTLIDYPKEKTLADIFEEQVVRSPDAVALRQHEETMTYRELNERAN